MNAFVRSQKFKSGIRSTAIAMDLFPGYRLQGNTVTSVIGRSTMRCVTIHLVDGRSFTVNLRFDFGGGENAETVTEVETVDGKVAVDRRTFSVKSMIEVKTEKGTVTLSNGVVLPA